MINYFLANQYLSDNFYGDIAVEKALEAISIYKLLLEAGDLTSFKNILKLPDKPLWIKACKNEIQNFVNYNIFKLVKQPEDANILVIDSKWVLRYKWGVNNQILWQKACYIAREFTQHYR